MRLAATKTPDPQCKPRIWPLDLVVRGLRVAAGRYSDVQFRVALLLAQRMAWDPARGEFNCFDYIDQLARHTGRNRRTVQRALKALSSGPKQIFHRVRPQRGQALETRGRTHVGDRFVLMIERVQALINEGTTASRPISGAREGRQRRPWGCHQ